MPYQTYEFADLFCVKPRVQTKSSNVLPTIQLRKPKFNALKKLVLADLL